MKVREALEKGIRRVRDPKWNEDAYLLLPTIGPWVTLFDEHGQKAIGVEVGSQKILSLSLLDDDCVEYTGKPHELDKS